MPESTIAPLTLSAEATNLGDSLSRLREFVATVASAAHLTEAATYRLRLASDEIATNIITHGYGQGDASGRIEVTATIADDDVTVSLDDTAVPYNPLEQLAPGDLDAPLETRREGGLGVFLAVRSVDEFRYEHVGGHNRNSLVMKRQPPPGPSMAPVPLRVLVIDGDARRRTEIAGHLHGHGHNVRIVTDGPALMAEQQRSVADVVLLSGDASSLEGRSILEWMKAEPVLNELPVIVLLTSAAANDVRRWIASGADDWVSLPADLDALEARIETCLQRKRSRESERLRSARVEKLAEQMERVVLPIGLALSGETDLDRLMERILVEAKALCRADGGTIYLRGEDHTLRFAIVMTDSLGIALGGTSGNPVSFPLLRLYNAVTGTPNHRNVATHVALTGQSTSIPDMYEAEGFDFSGTREFDERNRYRSVSSLTVPFKDHTGFVTGVLQLLNATDENGAITPFDEYDRVIVESLSSLAAVVLNNHLLIQRQQALSRIENDMLVARRIQDGFLPGVLPPTPGWQIDTRFRPARQVGGDFYDVFTLMGGRTLALAVGDVCDKGVGAALFMALTRSLIRAFALHHDLTHHAPVLGEATAPTLKNYLDLATAAELLGAAVNSTNAYIMAHHLDLNMFATLFIGMLDLSTGALVYMNAGHCSPMILDTAGGIRRRLEPTGPAVGMFADAEFGIQEERLMVGDTVLVFTDGVTDARNPGGVFFGEARLLPALTPAAATPRELLDTIENHVRNHIGGAAAFDDLTMLALRRIGGPTA